jgi:IMP dehydrogenase
MAQAGGMGVITPQPDCRIEEQAEQHVREVKRFESGMVINPLTIHARRHAGRCAGSDGASSHFGRAGGRASTPRAGKLVGILTNRDVRFADDPVQPSPS